MPKFAMTRPIPNVVPSYSNCSALPATIPEPKSSSMSCLRAVRSRRWAPSFTAALWRPKKRATKCSRSRTIRSLWPMRPHPMSREPSTERLSTTSGTRIRALARTWKFSSPADICGFRFPCCLRFIFHAKAAARSPLASRSCPARRPPSGYAKWAKCFSRCSTPFLGAALTLRSAWAGLLLGKRMGAREEAVPKGQKVILADDEEWPLLELRDITFCDRPGGLLSYVHALT